MYNDEWTVPPADVAAMWASFEEIVCGISSDLSLPVETASDALTDDLHIQDDGTVNRNTLGVIRYRGISEENDQRDYFLQMGRELLPIVRKEIANRKLTPEFVQRWGQLLFCHGFIVSYIMDDGDHVEAKRTRHAGNNSKTARSSGRKTFVARLLLRLMAGGENRKSAEHRAAVAIRDHLTRAAGRMDASERAWWSGLVGPEPDNVRDLRLASTFNQKHLYDHELELHASSEMTGLPPIDVLFPST